MKDIIVPSLNSLLKFLEEPDKDIIAILMTNNINNVLSTIISRCKVIKLNNVITADVVVDEELENKLTEYNLDDVKDMFREVLSWFTEENKNMLFKKCFIKDIKDPHDRCFESCIIVEISKIIFQMKLSCNFLKWKCFVSKGK